jgi:hypothetical protein
MRQVGFYLSSEVDNTSRVTFGGYAEDLVKTDEKLKWYPLVDNKGQFDQWQHKI